MRQKLILFEARNRKLLLNREYLWLLLLPCVPAFLFSGVSRVPVSFIIISIIMLIAFINIFYYASTKNRDNFDIRSRHYTSMKDFFELSSADLVLASLKSNNQNISTLYNELAHTPSCFFFVYHLLIDIRQFADLIDININIDALRNTAIQIARHNNLSIIDSPVMLSAIWLLSPKASAALLEYSYDQNDIFDMLKWSDRYRQKFLSGHHSQNIAHIGSDWAYGYTPILDRLATNISKMAKVSELEVSGSTRQSLVIELSEKLSRGNNAIALVGPNGSGKTNLVWQFASLLNDQQIFAIDANEIIANSREMGLERFLIMLFNEAHNAENCILFFDNSEVFFADGTGKIDLSATLMAMIQKNVARIILAFDDSVFAGVKDLHHSMMSNISTINIPSMSISDTTKIIQDMAIRTEILNPKVLISYDATKSIVAMADRYIQDSAFPKKAINLLDTSLSYARTFGNITIVDKDSVARAIDKLTGFKISDADSRELSVLKNLEDLMHQKLIGQDQAVVAVSRALRRARAGLNSSKRPLGSFLFLGPTGVGKSEMAKVLASEYFGHFSSNSKNLITIDCSEFATSGDIDRLLSLDDNGVNTSFLSKVKANPFSVVLFDEIEKAHPDIHNQLLQLLEEGRLTSTSGQVVNFKESIIIATSNAASIEIKDWFNAHQEVGDFGKKIVDLLVATQTFRAEFLNRFDELVLFKPLTKSELVLVAKLYLQEFNQTIQDKKIVIEIDNSALERIVDQSYDPMLGARPLRRTFQNQIENLIADKLLSGELFAGQKYTVTSKDF